MLYNIFYEKNKIFKRLKNNFFFYYLNIRINIEKIIFLKYFVQYKKMTVECPICINKVSTIIKCNYCEQSACKKCQMTFLMGLEDPIPRCMNSKCKKVWNTDFMNANFDKSFLNHTYRIHRSIIELQRQRSLLPTTQPLVANRYKRDVLEKTKHDLYTKNTFYTNVIRENKRHIEIISRNIRILDNEPIVTAPQIKKVYIKNCPNNNCRGFLDKQFMCELCKVTVCKCCFSIFTDEHKCNSDTLATMKLLATDTKPCPNCTTLIYKMNGCDQMFCTHCNTAFSWIKGTIETGVIHNPHYYEMQRKLNNGIIGVNENYQCGGLIPFPHLLRKLSQLKITTEIQKQYQLIQHIRHVELQRYNRNNIDELLLECRIKFLMNKIDEKKWLSDVKRYMKVTEKNTELQLIYTMFSDTLSDIFNNIYTCTTSESAVCYIKAFEDIRNYTNTLFKNIGHTFDNIAPHILPTWEISTYPKKKNIKIV